MSVPVVASISGLRLALQNVRNVGFVPTMGALHAGHARLIETARAQCAFVVVSIFVNPLQFDRQEDYDRYSRSLAADAELCGRAGASLIFAPSDREMYPEPSRTFVEVTGLTDHFCGASRPGHFRGVATVVSKLFHIVQPSVAFFGEKDAQQLAVIRRMVRDLDLAIRIVPVPTVREPDGLALSSRNARLSVQEREIALCLYQALSSASEMIRTGERRSSVILERSRRIVDEAGARIDYIGLADPETMCPVETVQSPVLALGAIFAGSTRLIDNVLCPFTPASRDDPSSRPE